MTNQIAKLWQGRLNGKLDPLMEKLNRSIMVDQRLYPYDIRGSIAHADMLGRQGILSPEESAAIIQGLQAILQDLQSGALIIDLTAEDIHTFIEAELTQRIGEAGKKLHTARSRNDQVTTDLRLYLSDAIQTIIALGRRLQQAFREKANAYPDLRMPGYTHLQRAQPIPFSRHLLAYEAMLNRDISRFEDCLERMMESPLGAGALAGTTFPIDRDYTASALGFTNAMGNTLDAVSDRDYALEFLSASALLMMHLSRFSEEIVLWCSQEFQFISLGDAYTTGSSMMPQKKNPDAAELIRGKTGRVYGSLMALLTVMKGLPLAYNKDMQEDKEAVFDTVDTLLPCLEVMASMVTEMTPNCENMRSAVRQGFLNATDLADYLVRKGVPFREAYLLTGQAVQRAIEDGCTLEEMPLENYHVISSHFETDLYPVIHPESESLRR